VRLPRRSSERVGRAGRHELPRGQVVVGSRINPEELCVTHDLGVRLFVGARVRQNRFQDVAHVQVMRVALIEEDIPPGYCRLCEVPGQNTLLDRQVEKTIGVQLHDGRFADTFQQIRTRHRQSA
jgi:hypothetical protein